jgi:hypothetical protein
MIYIEKFESQESRRRLTILYFQFVMAEIQHGGVWAIRSQVRKTAAPGSMQATFAAEGFKATQIQAEPKPTCEATVDHQHIPSRAKEKQPDSGLAQTVDADTTHASRQSACWYSSGPVLQSPDWFSVGTEKNKPSLFWG